MFAKSFCRASVPSLQTDRGNVLQNPTLGRQPCERGVRTLALLTIYELRMYHEGIHVRYSVLLCWMLRTEGRDTVTLG